MTPNVVDPSLKHSLSAEERDAARRMNLDGTATSSAAKDFSARLAQGLLVAAGRSKREKPGAAAVRTMEAVLSDYLRNFAHGGDGWGCRSHGRDAFSDRRIGYRTFDFAFTNMCFHGLLEKVQGHQQWGSFNGQKHKTWSAYTRSRATQPLLDHLASVGITPENHDDHFELVPEEAEETPQKAAAPAIEPLELRAAKTQFGRQRFKGYSLPIDYTDHMAVKNRQRVERLNAFFEAQLVDGQAHVGFRRVFNEGDGDNYQWNKGGRLISAGEGSYQAAKPAARAAMTINGEGVLEIDISASHLTILHALEGLEMPEGPDPYSIVPLPRSLTKRWITMTLGHTRFHRAWPEEAKKKLGAELGVDLQSTFPIRSVRHAAIAAFPVLGGWEDSRWTWADLQFVESEAVIGAVECLAFDHGIPCLPVHDSIIVPGSKQDVAREVLKATFKREVGVEPVLKVQ